MKRKKLALLAWLLAGTGPAAGQQTGQEATRAIPTGKLTWSDFTGSPDRTSPYWARTDWVITYTYRTVSVRHDSVKLAVQVQTLLKTTSWVKPDQQSEALLAHEQGHFDCGLLLAALFRKVVADTVFTRANYGLEVQQLFGSMLAEIKQLGAQYDAETNHMANRDAQAAWSRRLELLLQAAQSN